MIVLLGVSVACGVCPVGYLWVVVNSPFSQISLLLFSAETTIQGVSTNLINVARKTHLAVMFPATIYREQALKKYVIYYLKANCR